MDFLKSIAERIERDDELRDVLYSLILFGSYIRGDFVDDVSDLDFFAVLKEGDPESVIPRLRVLLEECTENIASIMVDLAWEYVVNLDDPLNKGYPFKFLTFYQEDFLENHVVVYGCRIDGILPRNNWRDLVAWRARRLLKNVDRDGGNAAMLRVGSGEAIRLKALMGGARSIRKDEILRVLRTLQDDESLEVFTAYLEGEELNWSEEDLVSFTRTRLGEIIEVD